MNTSLTFEVLLYLNSYYFGLFVVCEIAMNIVKYINFATLEHFSTDFGVLGAVCAIELFRVILARKGNLTERSKSSGTTLIVSLYVFSRMVGRCCHSSYHSIVVRCSLFDALAKWSVKIRVYNLCHSTGAAVYWNRYRDFMSNALLQGPWILLMCSITCLCTNRLKLVTKCRQ